MILPRCGEQHHRVRSAAYQETRQAQASATAIIRPSWVKDEHECTHVPNMQPAPEAFSSRPLSRTPELKIPPGHFEC